MECGTRNVALRDVPCRGGHVLIDVLAALAIVLLVAGLVTWLRRASACQRIIDAPAGETELMCYGGVMCRSLMTSGSIVRLDLLDWGVRIRGIPPARWIVPRWEARYPELAIAELVATPFSRLTVWFKIQGEPGGIGFLSDRSSEILTALGQHGVPVNRSVRQIRKADDMYDQAR